MLSFFRKFLDGLMIDASVLSQVPSSVQLIAVSKYATIEQMHEAYALGIRHFGESRLQTALPKISQMPKDVIWHFIGALQSNKINKIVEHFDYLHSVDSLAIAQAIAKCSKRPKLFLQVNTSGEATKQGFTEEELLSQYTEILKLNLPIVGLMTMAPLTSDEQVVRSCFARLRVLRDELNLPHLSMGMSQDFPIAIEEGATFVRIGSLLFEKK
ncbi:MAG: YggS family pyridoxal phosphate-dependent enzyme [Candidatus Melainabacteria bacterium]|nr:YggS family pyridoxal phosphate-dependent enzyme [Candidatus Melainabacteria bacterium]